MKRVSSQLVSLAENFGQEWQFFTRYKFESKCEIQTWGDFSRQAINNVFYTKFKKIQRIHFINQKKDLEYIVLFYISAKKRYRNLPRLAESAILKEHFLSSFLQMMLGHSYCCSSGKVIRLHLEKSRFLRAARN
jgi:hypothetical protein